MLKIIEVNLKYNQDKNVCENHFCCMLNNNRQDNTKTTGIADIHTKIHMPEYHKLYLLT